MGALWNETRKTAITSTLRGKIAAYERRLSSESEKALEEAERVVLEKEIQRLKKRVAKREGDPQYTVTMKHVGSLEDPLLWDSLLSRHESAVHLLVSRARRELVEEHGSADAAVAALGGQDFERVAVVRATRSPEHHHVYGQHVRELVTHGLVDGEKEYERLFQLGGPKLLLHAADEVRAFQEVDSEMGED